MKLTLAQTAAALGVDLIGDDREFSRLSINTRTLEKGDLFVAIKGDNFDAHEYIAQAEEQGACGLVVEHCSDSILPQIVVENTRQAFGDIASLWSSAFSLPIVAITGSCGKTTVKEMVAAIFARRDGNTSVQKHEQETVLATKGNLNNDIGVPLTLLRLNKAHKVAVIEMGANHRGEIKKLVNIVQPDVAVITNVTHAHVEGFGSIEGIAKAKAEIYTGLETNGTAVINADDDFADYWLDFCQQQPSENGQIKRLTFGLHPSADVHADYKQLSDGLEILMQTPNGEQTIHLQQFGRHNVYNALTATAVTIATGCSIDDVKAGLESFKNVAGRLEQKSGINGALIFDDTYNANPGSVRAGIDAIKQVSDDIHGEAILVLGDMGELGEEAQALHYQLGIDAAYMGIKKLFTVGELSEETSKGFNSIVLGQKDQTQAKHSNNKNKLIEQVRNTLQKNNVVLVKGSRSMKMETVVEALVNDVAIQQNMNNAQPIKKDEQ
ncbi:UDP-N-acetylmuramoyl-tripeptide--D-alanyl-D-alanine ligase [sulfur-oxidizing endosymbiont of Gigantopelta aegis]|uniref:UDP-N-acetylmuramoyl-tripeptide--D-alanyl-D- alanine ligase n=1 Tax=sulfur-oxidizing endosymbiont of Gigantopelta aegis TaxID=2794934 RepID=UPI0018DCF106|nr:UDP-N-acetylmuramoyl-tripeptide--D-alanyl-D-alanine ligase [sulfur-oxidizing endosymbiont of Gigantopelta aegis]